MTQHDPTAPGTSAPQIVVNHGATPTPEGIATLLALQQAVAVALDRKRRLGHSAVFWQDGQVVEVPADELPLLP